MKPPFIVTGCPRSGTMITAHILANDYNCTVIDEFSFLPSTISYNKINIMIEHGVTNFVIQSPTALNCFVDIFHAVPELHWVGVSRKKDEVIESMKRIHYRMDEFYHWPDYLHDFVTSCKQQWGMIKSILPKTCWTEITYDSLKKHPLFIPKEDREDFTVKQWKLNEPCGMSYWNDNEQCYLKKVQDGYQRDN